MKLAFEPFAILKHYDAMPLFQVSFELSFVVNPLFLKIVEVAVVERVVKHGGVVIIYFPMPIKLIQFPVSFIGQLTSTVV